MRKGIVFGAFDLLHAGHVHMLRQCKNHCDHLIVALQVNPKIDRASKNSPVESILEREIRLTGCKYVDSYIVYESDEEIPTILTYLKPDIRFLGSDYKDRSDQIIAKEIVPIHYTEWIPPTSSELRARIKHAK